MLSLCEPRHHDGKKKIPTPLSFQWRKFVKLHYAVMHIFLGSRASNLLVISFGEKCLLKSLHSCGSFVFSSSRVIVEIAQKQHSCLLNKGRVRLLELLAENAWSKSLLHNTEQIFESCITALLIRFRIVSTGPCRELWCHLCETWESSEKDVFTRQLITMSDAASLDVWGGEMLARCSHRDLMRRFRCSNAPSATLCNSEAPT